jgi:hypothetical protein
MSFVNIWHLMPKMKISSLSSRIDIDLGPLNGLPKDKIFVSSPSDHQT